MEKFYSIKTAQRQMVRLLREDLRERWIHSSLRRKGELPKDISIFICLQHFEEECYERDLKVKFPFVNSLFLYHFEG